MGPGNAKEKKRKEGRRKTGKETEKDRTRRKVRAKREYKKFI